MAAVTYTKIKAGLNLEPLASGVAVKGDIAYNSATDKLELYNGAVDPLVNEAKAATLTNKTMTGGANTFSGIAYASLVLTDSIVNADINSGASIAYSKLALSNSIVNADINASAAIAYSKLALTNSIVNADINASAAIAYSKLSLTNSIVNADIGAAAAIAYSKLNLSGSIVNADIGASAAIAFSKLASLTNSRALQSGAGGVIEVSSVTTTELGRLSGIGSAAVGVSDSNTLSNKTFSDFLQAAEVATPSTPASGFGRLYPKSNGKWYTLNDGGTETELGAGGSSGINYIANPNAETDTSGWATYADAAQATPVDGTGGSPNVTWTRSTSSPLRGTANFLFTKDAANRQGQGVSYDFTLDSADQAKPIFIGFDLSVASGTYATGDLTVYLYDVTNGVVIQPAPYQVLNATDSQVWQGYFQTSASSTSYRFILHVASTSASAYTVKFDNFVVGPTYQPYGAVATDWVAWTPTGSWSSNTTYTGYKRRVGDSGEYIVKVATSGAPTSATLTITLPGGEQIDTTKVNTATGEPPLGQCTINDAGSGNYSGIVTYISAGAVQPLWFNPAAATGASLAAGVTQVSPMTFANNDSVWMHFKVPIVGWSSNVEVSSNADTRVVAARYVYSGTAAITDGANLPWSATTFDTHGAFNSSNQTYTVPVPGKYRVTASFLTSNTAAGSVSRIYSLLLFRNGVNYGCPVADYSKTTAAVGKGGCGTITIDCVAGDQLKLVQSMSATEGHTFTGDASFVYAEFERMSGPAQIAASEKVYLAYYNNAGGSVTNGVTNVDFMTRQYDSHNAWSGTVFTAPKAGLYLISASIRTTTTNTVSFYMYKNGAFYGFGQVIDANARFKINNGQIYLNAGETFSFRSDGSATLSPDTAAHWITICSQG